MYQVIYEILNKTTEFSECLSCALYVPVAMPCLPEKKEVRSFYSHLESYEFATPLKMHSNYSINFGMTLAICIPIPV